MFKIKKNILRKKSNILCYKNICALVLGQGGDDAGCGCGCGFQQKSGFQNGIAEVEKNILMKIILCFLLG